MFNEHIKKELSAYCNGELSSQQSRRVAEHLLKCERCRKEYDEIKLGAQLASNLQTMQAPASMWGEIESLLRQENSRAIAQPKFALFAFAGHRRLAAVSVALLLALGIGAAWYFFARDNQQQTVARSVSPGDGAQDDARQEATDEDNNPVDAPSDTASASRSQAAPYQIKPDSAGNTPAWEVATLAGAPRIGSAQITGTGRLPVGQYLITDRSSRARISVANIGQVDVGPNSRIRLVETRATEHRLALERGKMSANILAPPRIFLVDTPSAQAVDLGCAYTLEVDDAGISILRVTAGWVAFVRDGRESIVPAGGICETRPGMGPGTPFFEDASEALQNALARFDFEGGADDALKVVLAQSRDRDTLTLWHLLARVKGEARGLVYDRMVALAPAPDEVTREGVMKLDRWMLDRWKEKLEWIW